MRIRKLIAAVNQMNRTELYVTAHQCQKRIADISAMDMEAAIKAGMTKTRFCELICLHQELRGQITQCQVEGIYDVCNELTQGAIGFVINTTPEPNYHQSDVHLTPPNTTRKDEL